MQLDIISYWLERPLTRLAGYALLALVFSIGLTIAARIFTNRLKRKKPRLEIVLEHVARPILWLVPLFTFAVMISSAPMLDELTWLPLLQRMLLFAMLGAATWLLVRLISGLEESWAMGFSAARDYSQRSRRMLTQVRFLSRLSMLLAVLFGVAGMLMTIPAVRQFGTSMMASAGVASIAVGFAARPVLGNLIAGFQIALTQPISIDDLIEFDGQPGYVEEITSTYIVLRRWDQRRIVVPLEYFVQNPISNWTRTDVSLTGAVFLWFDYKLPVDELRKELDRVCARAPTYNGRDKALDVCDTSENAMQLRILVSADGLDNWWAVCCFVREELIKFVVKNYPDCLPTSRARMQGDEDKPFALPRIS